MKLIALILAIGIFLAVAMPAHATQVIGLKFAEVVDDADIIFSGKIINIETKLSDQNGKQVPYTFVTVSITEVLKGSLKGDTYTFKTAGGQYPGKKLVYAIGDMPSFKEGQEVFLFLKDDPTLYSPVVGFFQGRFNLLVNKSSGSKEVFDNFGKPVTEGFIKADPANKSSKPVNYEVFKGMIKSLMSSKKK